MTLYNEYQIEENELGEDFRAHVTDQGIYFDHNWSEGCLYVSHEQMKELLEFRDEFIAEIGVDTL